MRILAFFTLTIFLSGFTFQNTFAASMLDAWESETSLLLEDLNETQRKEFEIIITANGVQHSVEHVMGTLNNAVISCGKTNPQLKDDLDSQFLKMQKALKPSFSRAKQNLNAMVRAQSVTSRKRMRNYVSLTNKVAVEKDNAVPWVPVTAEKDCKKLLKTLKDNVTINKLTAILTEDYGLTK